MKTRLFALAGLITLLGATSTIGVLAQQNGTPTPGTPIRARVEKSPNLHAALRALQNAKAHLQRADHDSQGHRAKALDLTNQAIQEAQLAIQLDK